ncbi:VCBS repeat-containing protein [candidate division KSB1 bacterium]|nr:VCBS repeat-containing protein [candidate division KSB1 bacterium]
MTKQRVAAWILLLSAVLLVTRCSVESKKELSFERKFLVADSAEWWWARSHADVNGDGLLDFFVVHNNAHGGWLGWYETTPDLANSIKHVIAETGPGGDFACGDLASGDIDNDGDIDVLGPVHTGEWDDGSEPTKMVWYENPNWEAHYIGVFPNFVKDVDLVDLNKDGKLDLAATCHVSNRVHVYRQDAPESWIKVLDQYVKPIHEGQHVGDLDGDDDIDVVSTAFWFENPGGDMTGEWTVRNIDPFWNSDSGTTWKHNATKIFCVDIDADNVDEVFISCSELFRDRVAWYDPPQDRDGEWTKHLVGTNEYAHTLQVADIDLDGDYDVLSGNNRHQGDPDTSPLKLFLNECDNLRWTEQVLTNEGAYNSYLGDIEGDGDVDIFRYEGHEAKAYEVWINQVKNE